MTLIHCSRSPEQQCAPGHQRTHNLNAALRLPSASPEDRLQRLTLDDVGCASGCDATDAWDAGMARQGYGDSGKAGLRLGLPPEEVGCSSRHAWRSEHCSQARSVRLTPCNLHVLSRRLAAGLTRVIST